MAGGTIANLNVKLVASIGGFAAGMANAAKPLASFAGNVAATSLKVGGMVSAITGLVGAGSLAALVHQSMENIDVQAKLADRFGMTTEEIGGLQHAAGLAGVDAASLTTAIEKMLKSLADAAEGTGPAADAIRTLGLDARKLANGSPDQAFKDIADGLVAIKNPAQRAQIAMDLFGKSGQALLPLMMSGAEGIKAAQEEAKLLGITFSRLDAAKVEAANDSFTRLQAVVTGVGNQLAVAVAPYIDAASTKLVTMATTGEGMGAKVRTAFGWVVQGVAVAADYFEVLLAAYDKLTAAAGYWVTVAVTGVDKVAHAVDWLERKLGGSGMDLSFLDGLAKGMDEQVAALNASAAEHWQNFMDGKASKAAARTFADIQAASQAAAEKVAQNAAQMGGALKQAGEDAKAVEKITATLDGLRKQVETFGTSEGQKKLFDLQAMGATPDQLAQAKALSNQLDSLNAAKKKSDEMQQSAKSVFDATRTPMEKYEAQIGNLSDMLNSGAIDWDTYGRAVRQAKADLEKSADAKGVEAPDLIKAGSAQAARLVYDLNRGSQKLNPQDLSKKQLAEAQESSRLLDRIERNTRPADDAGDVMDI